MIYNAKNVFLSVNASFRWLNNVGGRVLSPGFLTFYWSADLEHFFTYRPLLPIGWRIAQILFFYANSGGKRSTQRQPLLVQYTTSKKIYFYQ
jgi:hypothetical protein